MIRALVDTDVILDFVIARPTFEADAAAIWQANVLDQFEGYISAVTPVNVFYVCRKVVGIEPERS